MKHWIAIYSQTGSEIEQLIMHIGRQPTFIFSDREDERRSPFMKQRTGVYSHNIVEQNIQMNKEAIITLHGYLRVISEISCNVHDNIYNGHPGLITEYPELKGKDPQEKILHSDKEYSIIGSVIHKVIPEVDSGEIIVSKSVENDCKTDDDVYNKLRKTSMDCWREFFNKGICE